MRGGSGWLVRGGSGWLVRGGPVGEGCYPVVPVDEG